jgi:ATP-binding cassette, subfamily B, bacterial MsbA
VSIATPQPPARKERVSLRLDEASRVLLKRFLADWVWPRWREFSWTIVLTACLAIATGRYPTAIKNSFDALMSTSKADPGILKWVLVGIIGITAIRSLFLYLQAVATNRFVLRLVTDIQQTAFTRLIGSDFARLARDTPGRLVSKLTNDITFIQSSVMAVVNSAIRDLFQVTALIYSMFSLDWQLTLIVVLVYPLGAIPIAFISRRLRLVAKQTQNQLGDLTSLLTENLSGARLIKSFRLEDYASKKLDKSFDDGFRLRLKSVRTRARLDPMLEALGGLAVAGVIAFAYLRISSGISTVGDFMGFLTALLIASQPIKALGNLSGKIQEGLSAIESIYEILDEKPHIVDRPAAKPLAIAAGAISFKSVSFAYDPVSRDKAVYDFTLDVPGGKTVALVGRSGAGKSTIVNLVPRLFDVTSGSIAIDGQDVRSVTLASLRDQVSIVSQDITLFDDTIMANIALGRLTASEDDIIAAAKAAAAHDFIMAQPLGYQTVIGDRGGRLSGGQRQRLALARAILKDAPILLLDEATSALDTESEQLVQDALARFTKNRTTLVIAHRLSTVQRADQICVMDAGYIVERGTHAELLARNGSYARLAGTVYAPPGLVN